MADIFSYGFINNAILATLIGSISCGLIGTYIVTKRLVFITGGITHASFGGLGMAYFIGLPPLAGAAVFGSLAALGVEYLSDRKKIRVDSTIAMAWSLGMAIGIIFIFLTPGYTPNLMSYLFGSILTVSAADLYIMTGLMVVILLFFLFFYRQILYVSFDSDFAKTIGIPVRLFSNLLIVLVALTAVLYIRVAGIILVLSLLTVPQNLALQVTRKYSAILVWSVIFGWIGSLAGLALSYWLNIPSGAAIIFALISEYLIGSLILGARKNWRKRLNS